MIKKNQKNKYGFSLVETLIAVTILMIAITGPLALVQAGLFSAIHQRNQVTATYLAQEAIEYIKNLRDSNSYAQNSGIPTNWLAGPDGSTLLTTTCGGLSGCYVDPHGTLPGNVFIQTVGTPLLPLRQHTDNGTPPVFLYYGYSINDTVITPYTRTVNVTLVSGTTDEATIKVTITWNDNGLSRTYTVSDNIYNYEQ